MRTEVQPAKAALKMSSVVQVFALALGIAALSEWLGPLPIALGVGKVVLLPMIWALLIGLVLGLLRKRLPGRCSWGCIARIWPPLCCLARCFCLLPSWDCWWAARCRSWRAGWGPRCRSW